MEIFQPAFPPKIGYVEVETDGVRQYVKVETEDSERISALESENAALQDTIDLLTLAILEG